MRGRPILLVLVVALFLYWVVQSPHGAALTVRRLFDTLVALLLAVADAIVQFLDALF